MTAFVFEGLDRVGKSTLLARLHKQTGLDVMTVRRPAENGWDATKEWRQGKSDAESITKYARENFDKIDFLLDRFSYSELVYCKVFKRPCDFEWYEELLIKNKDVLKVVIVQEELHIVAKRWEAEGKPTEHIVPIAVQYDLMIEDLGLVKGIDYVTFSPLNDNINSLIEWIQKNGKHSVRPTNQLVSE